MTGKPAYDAQTFEALGHPIRLRMVEMMAGAEELACITLEAALPIAKSTISYHVKILYRAGLIDIRRDGRWYHYRLRRDELGGRLGTLLDILKAAPAQRRRPRAEAA